ncbi:hypothetical protein H2198_007849 [Neophaeococcomyces mojaviensis]|uniref:Uncharacterized protein n=1 Tax=Neophaeococcomyces mojaviensis TaxID=3383035 RepID=A0ACC2ZZ09_9EURO|nr:hypothetical protein H2198_007849 [Knufia sp. JES_112]
MSTSSSLAGLKTFDGLNIEYERAYHNNPFKKSCIKTAISLLPAQSHVLDVGCGTGVPVSEMLSSAGLEVVGFDISPKMVELAASRIKGTFAVSDMLTYQPENTFAGVFMIFSHLQLHYADFHAVCWKFAKTLQPGGLFVIGQMPSDKYVPTDSPAYDEDKTYVEDYDTPFMGEPLPTFMMSSERQRSFLRSMGFEIVSETIDMFQPENEKCEPEEQQYIIAKRVDESEVQPPRPLPREVRNS